MCVVWMAFELLSAPEVLHALGRRDGMQGPAAAKHCTERKRTERDGVHAANMYSAQPTTSSGQVMFHSFCAKSGRFDLATK